MSLKQIEISFERYIRYLELPFICKKNSSINDLLNLCYTLNPKVGGAIYNWKLFTKHVQHW